MITTVNDNWLIRKLEEAAPESDDCFVQTFNSLRALGGEVVPPPNSIVVWPQRRYSLQPSGWMLARKIDGDCNPAFDTKPIVYGWVDLPMRRDDCDIYYLLVYVSQVRRVLLSATDIYGIKFSAGDAMERLYLDSPYTEERVKVGNSYWWLG